jgi:Zn-dependent M28 family amino/carboxypeptidase
MTTASISIQARRASLFSRGLSGRVFRVLSVGILALSSLSSLQAQTLAPADPDRYLQDIKTLSAPNMEGRGDGSKGLARARDILVHRYASLGLEPKGSQGFLQPFDIITGAELTGGNRFEVEADGARRALKLREDYIPFAFSAAGKANAGLAFAGYGITANEWKYDDYKSLDVKGKIVVLLRKEPAFATAHAPKGEGSSHGDLITKAILARKHGAVAVVVLNGKLGKGEEDLLPHFGGDGGQQDIGVPIVEVKNEIAAAWFKAAGKDLTALESKIDESGDTASFAFPNSIHATLDTGIRKKHATVSNVLAYLPGKSDEYIVLGAHYDHLGRGEYGGSLAPSLIGQFHPGADDNASGTAGLLELARILAPLKGQLPRGILFSSYAGEELGLLGSAAWVRQPTLPLDKAVAMINMDMIGRVSKNTIYIGGVGTAADFRSILEQGVAHSGLKAEYSQSGYSSSDHTSFVVKQIPVLFFFSGLHSDYHKPSDTWDKIDPKSAVRVVDLVADTGVHIDEEPARPAFVTVIEPHPTGTGSGSGSGYGPYFGSIPDFGQVETGVRFSDVRPGSPAAKAGLKGGDTMIQFDDQPIKNLYDFTAALRGGKVGDVVEVTVLRDGKPIKVKVTLEQRK